MPTVFTADVQCKNHQHRSHTLPSGRNSRLQNGIDCLLQAGKLADGGAVVINGDLFDDRQKLHHDESDGVARAIFDIAERNLVIKIGRAHV